MHSVLARHLQLHLSAERANAPDMQPFLEAVDRFYHDADLEQRLRIHANSADSEELSDVLAEAKRDRALLRALMDSITDLIFYKSQDGRYLGCNKAFERLVQRSERQVLGQTDQDVLAPQMAADWAQQDTEVLITGRELVCERWLEGPHDAKRVCLEIMRTPFFGSAGEVLGLIGIARDITARKLADETILRQANFDALTGLANRNQFLSRLHHEMKMAKRSMLAVALLMINLDRFHQVNDVLGHDAGDTLLTDVARRLCICVRETDSVARLGSDEFTVLLPGVLALEHVDSVAQKIINQLAKPFVLGKEEYAISASVGIALYPVDGDNADTLLKNAEQAMYHAKSSGRSRYSHFTPALQESTSRRRQLLRDLPHVTTNGQLYVCYQPIAHMLTGEIFKAEALVRWEHPVHGNISPVDFIPLAEESGAIMEIGDFVFREAAQLAKRMRYGGHPAFQVSINQSPVQFDHARDPTPGWLNFLQELGLEGDAIALEITEGVLMKAREATRAKFRKMREMGIQLSLDDFGTGYSSLSYLKRLDIDYMKIDQSFVRDLEEDPNDRALCEAMIVMAHKLGIKVVAEGIETQAQCQILVEAGCDYGQGYMFARPMPTEAFVEFLNANNSRVETLPAPLM